MDTLTHHQQLIGSMRPYEHFVAWASDEDKYDFSNCLANWGKRSSVRRLQRGFTLTISNEGMSLWRFLEGRTRPRGTGFAMTECLLAQDEVDIQGCDYSGGGVIIRGRRYVRVSETKSGWSLGQRTVYQWCTLQLIEGDKPNDPIEFHNSDSFGEDLALRVFPLTRR